MMFHLPRTGAGTLVLLVTFFRSIGGQCPSQCLCFHPPVSQVMCSGIGLTAIPDNIPTSTLSLSLTGNSISEITADDLKDLINLRFLDLTDNVIANISEAAFDSLVEMQNLRLGSNNLKSFGPRFVQPMANLILLDLSDNPDLADLVQCTLSPITNLATLLLRNSPVQYGLHLFGNSSSCSAYRCNTLSDGRCHLSALRELDVSNTVTDEVPVDLFLLTPNLETLRLQGNAISEIPDFAFSPLANLATLSVNYNNLTSVSETTFNGTVSLTKLEIGNLGLVIDPHTFDAMPLLDELSLTLLGQAVIDSLAPAVAGSGVTTLNLHHNFLVSIPSSMAHLSTLTSLDLSQNDIAHVPGDEFSSSLTSIDLSYNQLSSLDEMAFSGLGNLVNLSLCNNQLEIVPPRVLDPLPQSTAICLGVNPWHCNCTMAPIVHDSRSHKKFPYPHCDSPESLDGKPFEYVDEDVICPPPTTTARPVPTTTMGPTTIGGPTTTGSPTTTRGPTTTTTTTTTRNPNIPITSATTTSASRTTPMTTAMPATTKRAMSSTTGTPVSTAAPTNHVGITTDQRTAESPRPTEGEPEESKTGLIIGVTVPLAVLSLVAIVGVITCALLPTQDKYQDVADSKQQYTNGAYDDGYLSPDAHGNDIKVYHEVAKPQPAPPANAPPANAPPANELPHTYLSFGDPYYADVALPDSTGGAKIDPNYVMPQLGTGTLEIDPPGHYVECSAPASGADYLKPRPVLTDAMETDA